ncbi:MAG: sugar phosphate isomerase/epimerase [Fimbriimonadaceae bacterium]|nr:sugar phosphate isomerase/epimerase [Fimbriimonadaceae bacterium]
MPRLAVFPKGYLDQLCVTGEMTLREWLDLAATLDVDGVEMYDRFLPDAPADLLALRAELEARGLAMPMLCHSPDYTQPDPAARAAEVARTERMIAAAATLGAVQCRVLSGQARPGLDRETAIGWVADCWRALLPSAERHGVVLAVENHYKDGFWEYREFAQRAELFLDLLSRVESPWLRVNFDPSNALVAGDDPLVLLPAVLPRMITMHASDRYLSDGDLAALRQADGTLGYPRTLRHGVIGEGLNDYDRIFSVLSAAGWDGWISIEDGEDGLEPLAESAAFLRRKIAEHWPG